MMVFGYNSKQWRWWYLQFPWPIMLIFLWFFKMPWKMLRAKLPVLWATLETLKNWPHHSSVSIPPLAPNPTNNSVQNKLSLCYKSITHTALSCLCGCLRLYTPSHTLHSASDTHSLTVPHTKFDSHPPDSSHQTVHCWFPRLFCFQSFPFLSDRNPLWTPSNRTSRHFFFQNNRPAMFSVPHCCLPLPQVCLVSVWV